jgi:hypothetical protein
VSLLLTDYNFIAYSVFTERLTYPENVLICMHIAFVSCVIKVDVSRVIHPLTPRSPLQINIPLSLNRDKVRSQERIFFCAP